MSATTMIALSGGVDSAVSALLLKRAGHDVAGMFMKNWEEDDVDGACTAETDAADARRVAERVGMPFHARNFALEYWEQVFEHFLSELQAGRTPNPDVLCNREIKFATFVEHARDLGAEAIATGHYVRRGTDDRGRPALLRGRDPDKDQSYFLYALNAGQLSAAVFPVGELEKPEVRRLADSAGLPVATKKDSTGICFIGERNFDAFVDRYLKAEPGPVITPGGEHIGTHAGLIHYTLGQRRGLGIGGVAGYPDAPWFVAAKRLEDNVLVAVQDSTHPLLMSTELSAGQINWIAGEAPAKGRLTAKTRYRQPDQPCEIVELDADRLCLRFDEPQRAVTPGQSVVLYNGDICLGGGVIECSNAPAP